MICVGDTAPAFTLPSTEGEISLRSLQGKLVVLYFYPKDNTPGCTVESLDFSSLKNEFDKHDTVILGINKDTVQSHKKFCAGRGLTVTLLSDTDTTVQKAYGVWEKQKFMWHKFMGTSRTTFLINRDQQILNIWRDVDVKKHAEEVLEEVKKIWKKK